MKKNRVEFLYLFQDLCNMYMEYISKNDNSRLEVVIDDNKINMYIYKDKEVVDEFELTFNKNENNMYVYVNIIMMKILFRKKTIISKDNIFYNDIEIPNFRVVVNSKEMLDKMDMMLPIMADTNIYGDIDGIRKVHIGIRYTKMIRSLEQRVGLSRKLLGLGE